MSGFDEWASLSSDRAGRPASERAPRSEEATAHSSSSLEARLAGLAAREALLEQREAQLAADFDYVLRQLTARLDAKKGEVEQSQLEMRRLQARLDRRERDVEEREATVKSLLGVGAGGGVAAASPSRELDATSAPAEGGWRRRTYRPSRRYPSWLWPAVVAVAPLVLATTRRRSDQSAAVQWTRCLASSIKSPPICCTPRRS